MTEHDTQRWPSIPVADWQDTRDTLHLYTQVVGKIRLANEPLVNHWWNTTLYVTATGLTTSLMPHPTGSSVPDRLRLRAPTGSTSPPSTARTGHCRSRTARWPTSTGR